jgi:NAD(P)-dependent dehydrogenase (short-subunit alcohol dehydrogenase family)
MDDSLVRPSDVGRLAGKVAIVTGAARGLGAAIAQRFGEEGAAVLLVDVRDELGEEAAARVSAGGATAVYRRLDVTSAADWRSGVAACRELLGPPSVFVHNAFVFGGASLADETDEGWHRVVDVTLTGGFLGMRAVIPMMAAAGGGAIVNISSTHGGDVAVAGIAAYQAAKGGLTALTRHAAVTYADDGIRANCVHPGPIRTPVIDEAGFTAQQEAIAAELPLGRVAEPDEVAGAALYLASPEAAYVTGTTLVVDGGYTAL